MKKVKFWKRVKRERYDEWTLVEGGDESGVPIGVWKYLNRKCSIERGSGKLWPLDPMDAYQNVVRGVLLSSGNAMKDGFLKKASASTYLVSTVRNQFSEYKEKYVDRARHDQRAICDLTGDTQAFVEELEDEYSLAYCAKRREEWREAHRVVRWTMARMDADGQRGLGCWLDADGIWLDAARLYNPQGSVQGYTYRFRHLWAPAFRRVSGAWGREVAYAY